MNPPAKDLRANLATWAVPLECGPAVAARMLSLLMPESYDPGFRGQYLETTYFDTKDFDLRKARQQGDKYLTLRIRCYDRSDQDAGEAYALSWKTESAKQRQDITDEQADFLERSPSIVTFAQFLRADAIARMHELLGDKQLLPVATICCRRFATEDDTDRLTLDCQVMTNRGECLPFSVLEYKSTTLGSPSPDLITALDLPPLKVSKFLWSTRPIHGS